MSTPTKPAVAPSPTQGSLYSFFAPGGLLARTHPAYEFRRGQLQMAQAVEQAIEEKRHLIVEAGTGTGKTLAYLLPAIRSGKRVIISTATKALQEQLFYKDIPFLAQHLSPNGGGELRVCYMKGRSNYLCRQKLYDLTNQPVLNGLEEIEHYRAIAEWEQITVTGDRAELSAIPESTPLWPKLDARADHCIGQKCQQYERCFITEMRRKAAESDIIVVNHHLFFADLSIKLAAEEAPDVGVLPDCATVIFDEAHELEDVAGSYFGVGVSNLKLEELARDTERALQAGNIKSATLTTALVLLRERSQFFFSLIPGGEGRFAFDSRGEFLEEHGETFVELNRSLDRVRSELQQIDNKPDALHGMIRRAEELKMQLHVIMESQDRNTVFWIERRGGGMESYSSGTSRSGASRLSGRQNVFLQATPIDVSQILRQFLFERLDCAVLTSATLAVGGGFDYLRGRLGLEHPRERVVASHFNYEKQAMLYVPPDLPEPREPDFVATATARIREILEITRGRAFVLFTSYRQMHDVHDSLLGMLDYPMLIQGSAPKNTLLEEFRATPNAVLFATSSFWQGVDVQGDQLSCVIIDRLPFAVPNDPVVAARINAINSDGGNAFYEYQVPAAVITLKQGFGRLIRSLDDRGLLVLLDNRILNKAYGRVFLSSLPNYQKTKDLAQVKKFFQACVETGL